MRLLPQMLADKLNTLPCCQSPAWIQQQIIDTFIQVNDELPPFSALRGGCTASVTLRIQNTLYIANLGDSRTVLVRTTTTSTAAPSPPTPKLVFETRRDKAHLPDEKARIEALGGQIHIPPNFPGGSRVIVYSSAAHPPEPIGLAMSRSLGDWEWKLVGVIAEPIVNVTVLPAEDSSSTTTSYFLMVASDGVWDCRQPQFVAQRLSETVPVEGAAPAVLNLVRDVSPSNPKWYRDDMTLIYVPL